MYIYIYIYIYIYLYNVVVEPQEFTKVEYRVDSEALSQKLSSPLLDFYVLGLCCLAAKSCSSDSLQSHRL